MSAESEKLFTKMLSDAGMPVTEEEMNAEWRALNEQHGSQIQNDSKWSPFWRLITSIVTTPCKGLVKLLVSHALPNVFLKYATDEWLDLYAWGVDLERKAAVKAEGVLTVTRTTSAGELLIPAGTEVDSPKLNGHVYRIVTTADVTIQEGSLSGSVPVRATVAGAAHNLGPGYYSILVVPISGVASVANSGEWLTIAGADKEKDEELRLRCRNQFSAVGQYHHDAAYTADIAIFAGIRTDYLYFEHDAPRGPGSANCYVMIESGAPTQEFVDTINAHVNDNGNHGHGDDMRCFPMPDLPVDLAVTATPGEHLKDEEVSTLLTEVENRVRCAFRENTDYEVTRTLPWSLFSFSRLSEELHQQLPDLKSVAFNLGDITSTMNLPKLNTLVVTKG